MKKNLLLLSLLAVTTGAMAQNIQDQKVTFKYTQLPQVNINDGTKQYSVSVMMNYLQRNADSLSAYEIEKQRYIKEIEQAMEFWNTQRATNDKAYYTQMMNYENQVNAGTPNVQQPVRPPQTPFTFNKPAPKKPFTLKEVNPQSIMSGIKIEGMKQVPDYGVKVILSWDGFERGIIRENKKGTGPTTRYTFDILYRHPVSIRVEVPGKGIVVNERINETEGFRNYTTPEFKTKAEFQIWWIDNQEKFWNERQDAVVMENVNVINGYLTNKFGYPVRTYAAELYTVKSKEYDYSDYLKAYQLAQDGMMMLQYADKFEAAKAKMNEAVAIWNKALQESNVTDRKARVDKNVTAATYVNLTYAYLWMNDFSNAEMSANKTLNIDVGKYNRDTRPLLVFIKDQQQRYNENNH